MEKRSARCPVSVFEKPPYSQFLDRIDIKKTAESIVELLIFIGFVQG